MAVSKDPIRESPLADVSLVAVQRFEEAVGWRAGLPPSESVVPLAFLPHVSRRRVDLTKDARPAPLIEGLGAHGVNGGTEIRPVRELRVGEPARSTVALGEQYQKVTANGPIAIVVVNGTVTGRNDKVIAEVDQWMIYRQGKQ